VRLFYKRSAARKLLYVGAALWMLGVSAARADEPCDLEVKILKNNILHVVETCKGIEVLHKDWTVYHPRGEQYHDAAHECKLLNVERIDKSGVNVQTYCEYRIGNKQSTVVIQSTDNRILITNAENY